MNSHNGIGLVGVEEDGYESSDCFEGAPPSADNGGPPSKKKFRRHTPHQIQELEAFFKHWPHPDERQRRELSMRLGLENKQIKFWFQNKRNQLKTQLERHVHEILKQENDQLRAENVFLKQAVGSHMCNNCGGPVVPGEISFELHQLGIENARLKDELSNILPMGFELDDWALMPLVKPCVANETPYDRPALVDAAASAMDELLKMAQMGNPLWIKGLHDGLETLNVAEYERIFPPCIGIKPRRYMVEATRETALVPLHSLALVETLMDANRWADMFPCLIARATTVDVLSNGTGGTRDNALQVMDAEFHIPSPLVPNSRVRFVRFCKQHSDSVWAVVDVSTDPSSASNPQMFTNCRRLPSGCVIQDMDNKYTKVTWVEHSEYDESTIHLLRPLLGSGFGFGAQRWIAALQRQCHQLTLLMSPAINGITAAGRKSMLRLARRMTYNFNDGICASSMHKWGKLNIGNAGKDVKVMVRKYENDPGEACGVVLSAATSVWMPLTQQRLFDFLRDVGMQCHLNILSNGRSMLAVDVAKGPGQGDCVTLFSSGLANGMIILQETWSNASGALIVYAPVDEPSVTAVMNGGDPSRVVLLPSGFSILPGGSPSYHGAERQSNSSGSTTTSSGCLLTTGFQILVNGPGGKLRVESVETVIELLFSQVQKIKADIVGAELTK